MFGPDLDRAAGSQGAGAGAFPLALFRFLGLAVLLAAGLVQPVAAQERVALVVGNSAYQHIAALRNPKNDAGDLSARLAALGFEVFGGADLDRRALVEALIKFGRAAEKAEVALFFYAGHGLQVNGQNYLVPIDAMVEFESEIDLSLVSLSGVMQQLERGSRTNIVFLDACRDNPFAKELSRTMGNRSAVALNKGLGRIQSGSGTFIAFATQPDAVAADGTGRNSPFTTALLAHIGAPGESISDMMIEVRNDVIATTNGAQVPWDSSSLTGRFSFAPETVATAPANEAPASATIEKDAYGQAVAVGSCGAYEAFQRRFPGSFYAELAKERAVTACAAPSSQQLASAPAVMATRSPAKAGECETGPFEVDYCASSVLPPIKANHYSPGMMFDGTRETAWVEGDKADGVGETLTLHFGRERTLAGFEIINGYDKDQRIWSNNSRVKVLEATADNSPHMSIELRDVRGPSRVDFNPPLKTSYLQLQISEIYPGAKYRDTAISELYPIFSD
jgi:uncharacterized caspase-like protein